jgi:hypothetical protein
VPAELFDEMLDCAVAKPKYSDRYGLALKLKYPVLSRLAWER